MNEVTSFLRSVMQIVSRYVMQLLREALSGKERRAELRRLDHLPYAAHVPPTPPHARVSCPLEAR